MKPLQISVDPRMELLSAVQLLAGDHRLDNKWCAYKDQVQDWFSPYANHSAVTHYKFIMDHFCYDAPINSIYFMNFTDKLDLITEPLPYFYDRAEGKENWMLFFQGLKEFAEDSKFLEFWNEHQVYYKGIVEKLKSMLSSFDIPGELESYFGMSFDNYSFISSPLQEGGYGGGTPEGNPNNASCTIGFDTVKATGWTELGLRHFLWHEFGHGFVNPIVDIYLEKNIIDENVYSIIEKDFNEENLGLYQGAFFQEGIVRGISHRLTSKYYVEDIATSYQAQSETFGYTYMHNIMEALKTYESEREIANINFKAYLPILMQDIIQKTIAEGFRCQVSGVSSEQRI